MVRRPTCDADKPTATTQIKLEFLDARGGAGGADGPPRPMMKRFKFKVYNPVAITTTHRQIASSSGGSGGQQQQHHHHHHAESEVSYELARSIRFVLSVHNTPS